MRTDASPHRLNGHRRSGRRTAEPPADTELERTLLASLFTKPEAMDHPSVVALLPHDFVDIAHRVIYRHLVGAKLDGHFPEVVPARLKQAGELTSDVNSAFIAIIKTQVTGADAAYYSDRLREIADRRRLWELLGRAQQQVADGLPADDIRGLLAQGIEGTTTSAGAHEEECIVVNMADVQPRPVKWLWPSRIPIGKLTVIAGEPGIGKSYLTIDLAARVSTGNPWPDSNAYNPAGAVVLISSEDDVEDTIRPRLDAAAADVRYVRAIQGIAFNKKPHGRRSFTLQDLPTLERTLKDTPGCRLVVIDPINAYLGATDSHKNADVRAMLAPLGELAAQHNVALVAISHFNKSTGSKAITRVTGSMAFVEAARAAWAVAVDKDDPKRRLVLPIKNNLAQGGSGLAYTLVNDPPPASKDYAAVAWETNEISVSADDALSEEKHRPGPDAEERERAKEFLREQLASGPRPVKELNEDARTLGIALRTLQRAAKDIGAVSRKSDGKYVMFPPP